MRCGRGRKTKDFFCAASFQYAIFMFLDKRTNFCLNQKREIVFVLLRIKTDFRLSKESVICYHCNLNKIREI